MSERRYSDDEVHEIFERAASTEPAGREEASAPRSATSDGFTLAELQDIGREAGLDPARVADAAAALIGRARAVTVPRQTSWGMPVAVGRIVELPRAPTDREWEMLVAELRDTFGARGRVASQGNLREWRNGNLVAAVEPTETGYRLRLGTLKGDAAVLNIMGVGAIALAIFTAISGGDQSMLVTGSLGVGVLLANFVRLPRWASTREQQMEYIAGRANAILGPQRLGDGSETRS